MAESERELREQLEEMKLRLLAVEQALLDEKARHPRHAFDLFVCSGAGLRLGFLLSRVEEVVPHAKMSPLPDAPAWVLGMLNVRGRMLPVVDVGARLTGVARSAALSDIIVIVAVGARRVGFMAEAVLDVQHVDISELQPCGVEVHHAEYLLGVVERQAQTTFVMSAHLLVARSRIPEDAFERGSK